MKLFQSNRRNPEPRRTVNGRESVRQASGQVDVNPEYFIRIQLIVSLRKYGQHECQFCRLERIARPDLIPRMKIVIPGGSGQVGTMLARAFHGDGHAVVVLSRQPQPAPWKVVAWDAVSPGPWAVELEGAEAVINLAGRSINCRYTAANRRAIIGSRVDSVRTVGRAVVAAARPPRVWLQAGTATIYAHRYDAPNDEATGLMADGNEPNAPETWRFANSVATTWEGAFAEFEAAARTRQSDAAHHDGDEPGARGGVFEVMVGLARRGLGGRMGDSGPAIYLLDPRRRFHPCDPLADRA